MTTTQVVDNTTAPLNDNTGDMASDYEEPLRPANADVHVPANPSIAQVPLTDKPVGEAQTVADVPDAVPTPNSPEAAAAAIQQMPDAYWATVQDWITGRKKSEDAGTQRIVRRLQNLTAEAQLLSKNINAGQQQIAEAQARHNNLQGQITGLANLLWDTDGAATAPLL